MLGLAKNQPLTKVKCQMCGPNFVGNERKKKKKKKRIMDMYLHWVQPSSAIFLY
jgi:hypothetical protein